jgi:formylmethanofuran dehydrogenase subunit E
MVATPFEIEERTLAQVVAFHGHLCPGLAMGVQAAAIALREVGPHAEDEEIVAVVETDMCAVDGIQFLTGCTFGKGNLVHLDYGKNAYTFYRRADGHAVRIAGRPDAFDQDTGHLEAGERTFTAIKEELARRILQSSPDRLFTVTAVHEDPPASARIYSSIPCTWCNEGTMETRIHLFNGHSLCPPCFERALKSS